jgi:hypothetical protein
MRLAKQGLSQLWISFDYTIMLVPLTPEENERRFKECMEWIHSLTREKLVELMGEEWLEDYRRQFP